MMGYYTRFRLEIRNGKEKILESALADVWHAIKNDDDILYAVGPDGDGGEPTKWYEHEDAMLAFSQRFPSFIFVLKGEGEEGGDLWVEYFCDGKMQKYRAKITYPEFDEEKWSKK